jgi:hypothetical protein
MSTIGSGAMVFQFVRQDQQLSRQITQVQQDNAQQSADSFVRRAGRNSTVNKQNIVDALSVQNKRGAAVDMLV